MILEHPSDPLVLRLHRLALKTFPFRRLTKTFWPSVKTRIRGAWFQIRPHDNGSETHAWRTADLREPRSTERLLSEVTKAPCFVVDIGANCGFYSVFLGKYAPPGSRVLAFEPNPEMSQRLRKNLTLNDLNDRVEVHETALSDGAEATRTLFIEQSRGNSSLEASESAIKKITVPTRRLSDVLDEAAEEQTIIVKIDIEGHEPSVLSPLFCAQDARLPDILLIEVAHAAQWKTDLRGQIADADYRTAFEDSVEGNTMFQRTRDLPRTQKDPTENSSMLSRASVGDWAS
ncbi:MAG: FkbM family methyltransferase [Pseudomonadota bacterium]